MLDVLLYEVHSFLGLVCVVVVTFLNHRHVGDYSRMVELFKEVRRLAPTTQGLKKDYEGLDTRFGLSTLQH